MRKFVSKSIAAFFLILMLLIASFFWVPANEDSQLFVFLDKNKMLEETVSPKIIFVGGSNLSFGLNSERISEKFQLPVVNTGLHGGIGLRFMLKNVEKYINADDIVVVIPEYENFYSSNYYGRIALASILADVYPEGIKYLSVKQLWYLRSDLVIYTGMKIQNYFSYKIMKHEKPDLEAVYRRNAFNKYGDIYVHWNDSIRPVYFGQEEPEENVKINIDMLNEMVAFKKSVLDRGAVFLLFPPVYPSSLYDKNEHVIQLIEQNSVIRGIDPDFNTLRYRMDDSLFYNTRYHLNKSGVDIRTDYIIEDLKRTISKN